jgi:hypothetical protein
MLFERQKLEDIVQDACGSHDFISEAEWPCVV